MQRVPTEAVTARASDENPWWTDAPAFQHRMAQLRPRAYLQLLMPLVLQQQLNRAVLVLGPRRVGKTILLRHAIAELQQQHGISAGEILWLSVDSPLYIGRGLEELVRLANSARGGAPRSLPRFVMLDEIQYLPDWERHLKVLVDDHPATRFVVSGSAAAALKARSIESGAGRFTEFPLPPLTFVEYLMLRDHAFEPKDEYLEADAPALMPDALNAQFVHYINYGGFPEIALADQSEAVSRYLAADIVDRVLQRDLPQLYGIRDSEELKRLLTMLAWNTGQEISPEEFSKASGVDKVTSKKYLAYLEAAFLIRRVHRIDHDGRRFRRATRFKVYLTNPSLRTALFGPAHPDDASFGFIVETAIFAQLFHRLGVDLFYLRGKDGGSGEVDLILTGRDLKPLMAAEIKWSDSAATDLRRLEGIVRFGRRHKMTDLWVTSRTVATELTIDDIRIHVLPAANCALGFGQEILRSKGASLTSPSRHGSLLPGFRPPDGR